MTEGERRLWQSPDVGPKRLDKEDGEEQGWRVCEDRWALAVLEGPTRRLCMEVPSLEGGQSRRCKFGGHQDVGAI